MIQSFPTATGAVDGTGLMEPQERRWLIAACLTVVAEQTKQAGLMDFSLKLQMEKNPTEFVSTTEMIAVQQACPFMYVDVMVSMYTACLGRQMDALKLIVEMVSSCKCNNNNINNNSKFELELK